MGTSLFGLKPKNTYQALLKTTANTAIDATLRTLSDGLGNDTPLQLSLRRVGVLADTSVTTQTSAVIQATTVNSSLVLAPNGTGALIADIPDGTAVGGNARGTNAVDLQQIRTSNIQVASGDYSVISGGRENNNNSVYGFIGGGLSNRVGVFSVNNNDYATICGGQANLTQGPNNHQFIGGGSSNTNSSGNGVISGGQSNTASTGTHATVGGGFFNVASGSYSVVGGGDINNSAGTRSTIGGGRGNSVTSGYGVIGGGSSNNNTTDYGTVGGGINNAITNIFAISSTIAGGSANNVIGGGGQVNQTIGGGASNTTSSAYATVSGGQSNTASTNTHATVVGGFQNTASGIYSVAGGGQNTTASGGRSFAFGESAQATGSNSIALGGTSINASGAYSTALNGMGTQAGAAYSLAQGYFAVSYLYGQTAFTGTGFAFGEYGRCQQSLLTANRQAALTTAATTVLSLDGTGITNLIIPSGNDRAWNVQVNWVAVVTTITGIATGISVGDVITSIDLLAFKRVGGISSASTHTSTATKTMVTTPAQYAACAINYTAGASQEMALTFTAPTFVGGGSVTMRVVARIELSEVAW
jgi:hypothetical protein